MDDKTPPMTEDELSDIESDGAYEETGDDLTIEDATDFVHDDLELGLCDYELMEQLDDTNDDQQSHIVANSATIHTTEYITKYEKARVLGWRAQHIKSGAAPMIAGDEKDDKTGKFIFKDGKYPREPYDIAVKELEYGRCPVIIGRRFPNGERMMVRVSDLKLI